LHLFFAFQLQFPLHLLSFSFFYKFSYFFPPNAIGQYFFSSLGGGGEVFSYIYTPMAMCWYSSHFMSAVYASFFPLTIKYLSSILIPGADCSVEPGWVNQHVLLVII
jgi:hypothetical protein